MADKLNKNISNAAKWSSITEVATKLVTPIVNMILARVIAPEAFGVVATSTMIVSFADMLTDAGFQKYIVQHEFKNDKNLHDNANVAFWTNLIISILIYIVIFINKDMLAIMVGNGEHGNVIAVASLQIILTSFSSIQMAVYRRKFDFKTLFYIRLISVFIPIFITLPLAFLGWSFWAIIIGNLFVRISNSILLTLKSNWKPKLYYNVTHLKEMLSFSIWSLVESISIWLTDWVDSFIIGTSLSQYHVGLYKNSTTMVNSILGIITQATTPVLFASLSRLQTNEAEFNNVFLRFQRIVSVLVLPLGVGIYLFRELATQLLLGEQWTEGSDIIGLWALTGAIMIVYGSFCSEIYRAKGKPKLSFIAQILHLIVLIPVCIISVRDGFWNLIYARTLVRFQLLLVHFIIMHTVIKFPMKKFFTNLFPTTFSAIMMGIIGGYIKDYSESILWSIIAILLCMIIYLGFLFLFPSFRNDMKIIIQKKEVFY